MDRYRYFIFHQKSMILLGFLQIASATVCTISGLIDGAFRRESALSRSRIPIWAGVFMAVPGIMALFSSQKKNPVLVYAMIIASIFSCFTALIVIVYASVTLEYGEKYQGFSDAPYNHPVIAFVLDKLVEGSNIAILIAATLNIFILLIIIYLSCRSLPCCSCYDSITGLEQLQSDEDQLQTSELVGIETGQGERIFNTPVKLQDLSGETDEEITKPPPYMRLT
uniref:Uncharacterized protein n=1 Tax=Salvator merianae TaxID=96440 RepID=A0A8D0C377_SALMN